MPQLNNKGIQCGHALFGFGVVTCPTSVDTTIYDRFPGAYRQMPHMLCLNSNRLLLGLSLARFMQLSSGFV